MFLVRYTWSQIKNNTYFLLGLCLGLFVTLNLVSLEETTVCNGNYNNLQAEAPNQSPTTDEYEPRFNSNKPPPQPQKAMKSLQRPRYYSTELGIREKLFIGVLTTENNINYQATAINKTLAHLANKIKFFITANVVKSNLSLANIVGFTDTREILKPFHVLKYITDNYIEEFDYFYLISDAGFVNGRKLMEVVKGISVSEDVYLGTVAEEDSHYCSLDAGMLLSNSVVKKVKVNLDWCVRNSYSHELFENIGRCITHSTSLRCRQTMQDQHLTSFKLPSGWDLKRDLKATVESNDSFTQAVSIYPVNQYGDFYTLQMYFARYHLESIQARISTLSHSLSKEGGPWPPGGREDPTQTPPPPPDRFHQPVYSAITLNSSYMTNHYHNSMQHTEADRKDIQYVLNAATLKVKNENPNLEFHSLLNGYKRFDPSRGMRYIFDMNFVNTDSKNLNGGLILKRMDVFKPLGKASMLPVPYVTENTRIALIMPVWEYETAVGLEFLKHYESICMERRDKIYLLWALIYSAEAPSKGSEDPYNSIKSLSLELSQKYKADGMKIGWVSIRLPPIGSPGYPGSSRSSGTNGGLMNLAIADLALRKLPPESLVLFGRPHMEMKQDFTNRIRMNSISGYQVFSALGFQRYHPGLASGVTPSKPAGRFAPWDFSVTSFYSRDYVNVRKSILVKYPIVRSDKDIEVLFAKSQDDFTSLFELFVKYGNDLHTFRGVEPGLSFKYDEMLFCPPESAFKNGTTVTDNTKQDNENEFQFGNVILSDGCLKTLAKDNFVTVTVGSRSQLAKLIFESGS